MSRWIVPHEQWVAWIQQGPELRAPASQPLDVVDARLVEHLGRHPFVTGDEETISRPELGEVPPPFESMTTMVRRAVDEPEEEDATRIRIDPERLEVALQARADGLEVSLDEPTLLTRPSPAVAAAAAATAATPEPAEPEPEPAPMMASPASEHTVIAAPPAQPPSTEHTVIAEAPSAPPPADDDGLFIPTLTRTIIATEAPSPPPDEPSFDDLPPAISGETVVG
ncbi:MAG: hypothetical protein KDK70_42250, partial [Myxococcales bacterium]|nr:hypothetical protein [Myxococcales bacterium]